MDAAPRKAMLQTAEMMNKFPQVRRRDHADAKLEFVRYLACGYRLARYLLGTFGDQLLYSSLETEQPNANRLKSYMDERYPELALLQTPLDPEVTGFIVDDARVLPKGTIAERLFGTNLANALALTGQLDGMKVALGEWDLFCSTWDKRRYGTPGDDSVNRWPHVSTPRGATCDDEVSLTAVETSVRQNPPDPRRACRDEAGRLDVTSPPRAPSRVPLSASIDPQRRAVQGAAQPREKTTQGWSRPHPPPPTVAKRLRCGRDDILANQRVHPRQEPT